MNIDYSNKWYREMCREHGLNADNVLSQSTVESAKHIAIQMKKFMDAKRNYPNDEELHEKLDKQIKKLNDSRMELMIAALEQADIMNKMGNSADKFFRRYVKRQEMARK